MYIAKSLSHGPPQARLAASPPGFGSFEAGIAPCQAPHQEGTRSKRSYPEPEQVRWTQQCRAPYYYHAAHNSPQQEPAGNKRYQALRFLDVIVGGEIDAPTQHEKRPISQDKGIQEKVHPGHIEQNYQTQHDDAGHGEQDGSEHQSVAH